MPLSCCTLLLCVLPDGFLRHIAGGGDKVTPGPHRGHSAEMGISLAEAVTAQTLSLDGIVKDTEAFFVKLLHLPSEGKKIGS